MTALLFIDFETTSLHVPSLSLLEGALLVAGLDGVPRMPIQHRYLEISKSSTPTLPVKLRNMRPQWSSDAVHSVSEHFARKMAEDSGLVDDWVNCDPNHVIRSGDDLSRLILNAIDRTCALNETVHICGAGAARFDFSILAENCPQVIAPPGERGRVHYRPIDTSGNMTGLLGSNYEEQLIKWFFDTHGFDSSLSIECDVFPRYCYSNQEVNSWLVGGAGKHRAAPDVARALVVQQALWIYGQSLRDSLSV